MNLLLENMIFSDIESFFKDCVVANHKLSDCPTFNGNPHEPSVKNLLNLYL